MIISHKHKFAFVSIPKTASTTIRSCLSQYSDILYHGDKEKLIIHCHQNHPISSHMSSL